MTKKFKFLSVGLLAVLVPFLAASEKSFKSIVDDWFDTCSVIVEMEDLEDDGNRAFYPVDLYVQGQPPETADLVIASDKAIFTQLAYRHSLSSSNRSLHPVAPQTSVSPPNKNISVSLKPFRENLLYSFRAYVDKKLIDDSTQAGAFVKFQESIEGKACRVEKDTWYNLFVGSSSMARFLFMLSLVFVLSILVALIKARSE
ncbi:hypothetical protein [Aliikangiella sp. G2MR2-5]|uniref:hypothetical protein n=1 Tax=Aliikangiella sp. G2MR2-5 TaxID=2788943 RepID=UPI0018AC5CE0|nr:hypothetical protein [Aliikangiella sp. G2MR2-5]